MPRGSLPSFLRLARRARTLPARERALALRALWYLILADSTLRRKERLPPVPPRTRSGGHLITPNECADAIRRAARVWPRASCLARALAGQRLLGGMAATVVIGVRRDATTLGAHAWLECDGSLVIGGAESDAYVRLEQPRR
jgi:transglutaminase superfamily protein